MNKIFANFLASLPFSIVGILVFSNFGMKNPGVIQILIFDYFGFVVFLTITNSKFL